MPLWLPVRVVPLLLGRLAVLLEPVRPLALPLAVGRLVVVGLEAVVGRVLVPSVRPDVLPATTRPEPAVLEAVGRVPLIDPEVVRPDTVAPLRGVTPLLRGGRLIEPLVPLLLPRRTLAP